LDVTETKSGSIATPVLAGDIEFKYVMRYFNEERDEFEDFIWMDGTNKV